MENSSSHPPIASPHGRGEGGNAASGAWDGISPHVSAHLSVANAFRRACVELFQPSHALVNAGFAGLLVFVLIPRFWIAPYLSRTELWTLALVFAFVGSLALSSMQYLFWIPSVDVELRPEGVCKRIGRGEMVLPWHKLLWICEYQGNIWMASFANDCFVPREAFDSREQSREFARLVRELRRTNGVAWSTIFTKAL